MSRYTFIFVVKGLDVTNAAQVHALANDFPEATVHKIKGRTEIMFPIKASSPLNVVEKIYTKLKKALPSVCLQDIVEDKITKDGEPLVRVARALLLDLCQRNKALASELHRARFPESYRYSK